MHVKIFSSKCLNPMYWQPLYMEYLGMESVEDEPDEEILLPTLWILGNEERYKILLSVCSAIVDDFTDIRTFEVTQE